MSRFKEPEISSKNTTATARPTNRPEQPRPWSTPGSWTITTADGREVSGYLPDWAEDDPSETAVPPELLPQRLATVGHRSFFEGITVNLVIERAWGKPVEEEEAIIEGSIDCAPFSADPAHHLPVVTLQICPGYTINALDPDGLAAIAAKLRAQADLLANEVHAALISARTDWAAHHETSRGPAGRFT
jgi:hypothetical protein